MKVLLILNGPAYGDERGYNALRLAHAMSKTDPALDVVVFLMADAVGCAKGGQKTPDGYYNIERMLKRVLAAKGRVLLCGTCIDARGLRDAEIVEGAQRSTMDELAQETLIADKVLVVLIRASAMDDHYEGRCLCGGVRFRAIGAPKWVLWCHCESCRRHSGAPASVFVSYDDDDVRMLSGEITTYESSPGVKRGFCARCGSTLTCTNPKLPNETHFHVGAFERAADLTPSGAFFGNECLPWFKPGSGPLEGAKAMAAVVSGRIKRRQS